MRRMLREYWERTTMVARAGSYYGKGFKGGRVVTQVDPLSPTIFNVVVDAVVRHWLTIAAQEAERRGERGREGQHKASLFYADDGMLALSDPPVAAVGIHAARGTLRQGGAENQLQQNGKHDVQTVQHARE